MDISLSEKGDCTVKIDGEMNIYNAAELKGRLIGALEAASSMEIDLSGVSEIDSSGLQVLLLAKKEAGAADKRVALAGVSPAVKNIFDLFSLNNTFLGQPAVKRE